MCSIFMNLFLLKLLIVVGYIMCSRDSSSSIVEAVDCCRLLCALESSNFVENVESVVEAVDCSAIMSSGEL